MSTRPHRPLRTLLASLPRRSQLGLAASLGFAERVTLSGAALALTLDWQGRPTSAAVVCSLGAVILLHRVACAALRVETLAAVLTAVTEAWLADLDGVADSVSPEAEVTILEGMYAAERCVGQRLPELLGDVPACVVLAVVVLVREPGVVVLEGAVVIAAAAVAILLVRNVSAKHADRVWRALLPALDDLVTAIQGRLEVVANGSEPRLLDALGANVAAWRAASRGAGVVSFVTGRAPAIAAAAVAALLLLRHGGWTETSLASAALLASVVPPFAGVARGALDLSRDLVRAAPVIRCLERAQTTSDTGHVAPSLPADVTWSGVSFSYAGQSTPSLHRVTLTWRPGEILALAGQNGSGKSTLVRVLLGLHSPSEGVVAVGGTPLDAQACRALRQRVAYLAQRPYLPDRITVAEAIGLVAPANGDAAIEAALTRLELWPVLLRHRPSAPLDVKVGTLSAGEKQRVAIARVLLRDTPLLLLDEPDANLDAEGIAVVGRMVREEVQRRMVLVVAHSPALLACADRVIRFERGHAVGAATG